MKKALFFSLMAFLALWMPSCKNEDSLESEKTEQIHSTITVNMASLETDGDTKTSLDGLNVKWCEGDEIILISKADFNTVEQPYGIYKLKEGEGGSQSATFELVSGSHNITDGEFYGIYCPDGCSFSGGSLNPSSLMGNMIITDAQTYCEDGITDGLLTMWGYGESIDNIQFNHNQSVLQIPLWCNESGKKISKIEVSSSNGLSGNFYHNFLQYEKSYQFDSYNPTYKIVYSFGGEGLEVSDDSEDPTLARIVIPGNPLSNLTVTVYDQEGTQYFRKSKNSVFSHGAGKVVTLPSVKLIFESVPNVKIKVGEEEECNILEYEGIPSGTVAIISEDPVLSNQMDLIVSILNRNTGKRNISLDLSNANIEAFESWFKNCKQLYEIKLPSNMKSTPIRGLCLPNTITSRIDIPEGMEVLGFNFLQGPVCEVGIPASVKTIRVANAYTVTGFDVDENNVTFASVDGVLYSKDMSHLVYYPGGKTGVEYIIPEAVSTVGNFAFMFSSFESLIVHANVTKIGESEGASVFSNSKNLKCIELKGLNTDLVGITSNDNTNIPGNQFDLYGNTGTIRTIKAPLGCDYYRNHPVWSLFYTKVGWTFDDGCGEVNPTASIGTLGTSAPSFDW